MYRRITSFIPGACFGHWDGDNEDCAKCSAASSCENATEHGGEDVRRIFKVRSKMVADLVKKWHPDNNKNV